MRSAAMGSPWLWLLLLHLFSSNFLGIFFKFFSIFFKFRILVIEFHNCFFFLLILLLLLLLPLLSLLQFIDFFFFVFFFFFFLFHFYFFYYFFLFYFFLVFFSFFLFFFSSFFFFLVSFAWHFDSPFLIFLCEIGASWSPRCWRCCPWARWQGLPWNQVCFQKDLSFFPFFCLSTFPPFLYSRVRVEHSRGRERGR